MKRLLEVLAVLLAFGLLPAMAQSQYPYPDRERDSDRYSQQGRLSPDDQKKFDKAYEDWTEHRRKRDRDDIAKDEGKMLEIMARYNIPRDVPYDVLASGARGY